MFSRLYAAYIHVHAYQPIQFQLLLNLCGKELNLNSEILETRTMYLQNERALDVTMGAKFGGKTKP